MSIFTFYYYILPTAHYVYDTNRVDHITIDKLVYFDSYNGVNQSVLCKLYDHQKQSNVLTQDLLQDFSFCHPNGAEKFKEILISRTYPTVSMDRLLSCHDNPCLQVLFRYNYYKSSAIILRIARGCTAGHFSLIIDKI